MSDPLPPAIPAATLVIFRNAPGDGPPQLLMIERAATMAFAAGALVFPGGRLDPGDHALAAQLGGDDEAAARIAAIRETVEEVGLAIGLSPQPPAGAVAAMRAALHEGTPIGEVLADAGVAPLLGTLVPFARWRPAHRHLRIYDTRFYLARLPAGAPEAVADARETVRLFWASAAEVLALCDAGEANAIFPTRRTLERLARFASVEEAEADARAHPIEVVTPWIEHRDGDEHLCIPEGLGYPVTSEPLAATRRG
jgi:8-oxo-dGTP pyrophosphatase MutT (NUDIX family)